MRYAWLSPLAVAMVLSVTPAPARGDRDDEPFLEMQQDAEFRQRAAKQQTDRLHPHVAVHPGPEGSPEQAHQLLRDRLAVLQNHRANAARQQMSPEEIARIDEQISSINQELAAYE
ncbi:MAG: hypothetical protein PHN82_09030 [bacterium]|nr:hypothetical protein [bacterium]